MTVLSLAFEDKLGKWTLSPTDFAPFNLLVGASGVGKTRILDSLQRIRQAALGNASFAAECVWTMRISEHNQTFVWRARTERALKQIALDGVFSENAVAERGEGVERNEKVWFAEEVIQVEDGPIIFQRGPGGIVLNGKPLPRFKNTESAIELFGEEESIRPIRQAMQRFRFSRAGYLSRGLVDFSNEETMERISSELHLLDELRNNDDLNIIAKGMLLQNKFPNDFQRVVDQYREIFGYVEEIKIAPLNAFYPDISAKLLTVAVRERNVSNWLIGPNISSGMSRTLIHLLELALAPAGTVVLIDEFENSLGVNCLPQVAEHMLGRARDLQFIITSHHPYVINNVPPEMWRVVTRRGSVVRVRDYRDLPALNTGSRHDKFTILNNLPEFEQGVE